MIRLLIAHSVTLGTEARQTAHLQTRAEETEMPTRVAINGFGRVGRSVLRIAHEQGSDLEIVAINDLADAEHACPSAAPRLRVRGVSRHRGVDRW